MTRALARLVIVLLATIACGACIPTAPCAIEPIRPAAAGAPPVRYLESGAPVPGPSFPGARHGAPVDLSAIGLSAIGLVCETQPRTYCDASGAPCWRETDLYVVLESDGCPIVPID